MYKCTCCGQEFEGNFCTNCGAKRPTNICPSCGKDNPTAAAFCIICGQNLRQPVAQQAAAPSENANQSTVSSDISQPTATATVDYTAQSGSNATTPTYSPNTPHYATAPTTNQNSNPQNTFAILGFVFSLMAYFVLLGIIFSIIGLVKSSQLNGKGKGFAIAGIVIPIVYALVAVIVLISVGVIKF
jgi:hypothetical protein